MPLWEKVVLVFSGGLILVGGLVVKFAWVLSQILLGLAAVLAGFAILWVTGLAFSKSR